jgi:hypothetical protein
MSFSDHYEEGPENYFLCHIYTEDINAVLNLRPFVVVVVVVVVVIIIIMY